MYTINKLVQKTTIYMEKTKFLMKDSILFGKQLRRIQLEYMTGEYSLCPPRWGLYNVSPRYNKLYYIVKGECYIKINGEEYIGKPGQLFLLPSSSTQTYFHISEDYVSKYWLHFSAMCGDRDFFDLISLPHFIQVKDGEKVSQMFEKVFAHTSPVLPDILQCIAYISQLLAFYIEDTGVSWETLLKPLQKNEEEISEVLAYIESNLANDITVAELCEISHLHPNYFIRYFREKTGYPPIEYINNLRIARAKEMLQNQSDPIHVVAASVGFKNSNYFSRIFKQKTGETPFLYRFTSRNRPGLTPEEEK